MDLILISNPDLLSRERDTVKTLFTEAKIDCFHLRKPEADLDPYRNVLNGVPVEFRNRVMLHQYHEDLAERFKVRGIHHRMDSDFNAEFQGVQSKAMHSIQEIKDNTFPYDYIFLSPVFDSISKTDYKSSFNLEELEAFLKSRKGGPKIIALGGITAETAKQAKKMGFDGVAVMGYVWQEIRLDKMIARYQEVREAIL